MHEGVDPAWPALGVALLVGLRHASDPDHVTAVATLALSPEGRGPRAGAALGLAWGSGHALALVALGLPVVLAGASLPPAVQRLAELGVGLVIALLAARLLARWRRGELHLHRHAHGALEHAHPHFHLHARAAAHEDRGRHDHRHRRSPLAAFGVGLLHGVGGSAAAGLLLVASSATEESAALSLAVFALGTAGAMTLATAGLGLALARGLAGLAFGAWYAFAALAPWP